MSVVSFVGGTAVLPDRLVEDAVVVCRDREIAYVGTAKNRIPATSEVIDAQGWLRLSGIR